jgi:hypothetical protein
MATLYVSWLGGAVLNCAVDPIKSETVTTSGTSAQSGANPGARVAQLRSDAAHYVTTGGDPTATAGKSVYVPANETYYLAVGSNQKIAAITV